MVELTKNEEARVFGGEYFFLHDPKVLSCGAGFAGAQLYFLEVAAKHDFKFSGLPTSFSKTIFIMAEFMAGIIGCVGGVYIYK